MDDELKEFERAIRMQYVDYLDYIEDSCRVLFKQAISTALYKYYSPVRYDRTYQLLSSIKTKVLRDVLYIYVDYDLLKYTSAVTHGTGVGDDVSYEVPWFLTNDDASTYGVSGHHDMFASTRGGQYHSYEKRNYLELAKQLIESKFDIKVEVVNDLEDSMF